MLRRTERVIQDLQQLRGATAERKREQELHRAVAARLAAAASTLLDHAAAPGTGAAERNALLLAAGATLSQVQAVTPAVEVILERLHLLQQVPTPVPAIRAESPTP